MMFWCREAAAWWWWAADETLAWADMWCGLADEWGLR